jgi:hypothetical protein
VDDFVRGRPAMRIDMAVREAMDAIADDDAYAAARAELEGAVAALRTGTTVEARRHLTRALRLIDDACPV